MPFVVHGDWGVRRLKEQHLDLEKSADGAELMSNLGEIYEKKGAMTQVVVARTCRTSSVLCAGVLQAAAGPILPLLPYIYIYVVVRCCESRVPEPYIQMRMCFYCWTAARNHSPATNPDGSRFLLTITNHYLC